MASRRRRPLLAEVLVTRRTLSVPVTGPTLALLFELEGGGVRIATVGTDSELQRLAEALNGNRDAARFLRAALYATGGVGEFEQPDDDEDDAA